MKLENILSIKVLLCDVTRVGLKWLKTIFNIILKESIRREIGFCVKEVNIKVSHYYDLFLFCIDSSKRPE